MKKALDDLNPILSDLFIIDLVYLILGEVVIILLTNQRLFYGVGLLIGVIYSMFAAYHISVNLRDAVYMADKGAAKKSVMSYGIRVLVMAAMLITLIYTGIGSVLTAFIGMFSLKVSAYIQPFTHKLLYRSKK